VQSQCKFCFLLLICVQVELIDGQWHNLPRFPTLIREFNGLMMGSLPHLTEPWWSRGLEFVGDDYYKRQRLGLQQRPAAAAAVNDRA
jgi:hypothetical protein